MKKLLLITFFILNSSFFITSSHAVKLCKGIPCDWVASHPWKSDTYYEYGNSNSTCSPQCETNTSSADATWTVTMTNAHGRSGSISGQSRCAVDSTTNPPAASSAGMYCWCRVTNIVDSTAGNTCPADSNGAPWVFGNDYSYSSANNCRRDCAYGCAYGCVQSGANYDDCSRSALLTIPVTPTVSSVTCPASGTCTTNSSYKTVADTASCGTGYVETTSPALTISGSYTDSKGSFTYTNCTAN
jgi:hypothetical protein